MCCQGLGRAWQVLGIMSGAAESNNKYFKLSVYPHFQIDGALLVRFWGSCVGKVEGKLRILRSAVQFVFLGPKVAIVIMDSYLGFKHEP